MMFRQRSGLFLIFLAIFALSACSQSSAPPAVALPTAKPAPNETQANKELALYQEMLRTDSYELAQPIGQEIVTRFAGTAAAAEVSKTLADVAAKAKSKSEGRRMSQLWAYQSGKESGGTQNTASMYSRGGGDDRIRLVLRRHSAWGQSAYLFGSGAGFACAKDCAIEIRFDDRPVQRFKARLPETGEPAIFIEDDRGFIAKMEKATSVSMDVMLKGKGKRSLVFEVGGYDATKFLPIARK
jgi:hypothetical protein